MDCEQAANSRPGPVPRHWEGQRRPVGAASPRDGHASVSQGSGGKSRSHPVYGGTLRGRGSVGPHAPRLLPGASGHEPDAIFVAAPDASRPPSAAHGRSGSSDRDRDRDELWLLGIRALLGGVSVAVRGIALGSAAPAPRRPHDRKKIPLRPGSFRNLHSQPRPGDPTLGSAAIPVGIVAPSDRGSDPAGMQGSGCREAAQAPLSIPMTIERALTMLRIDLLATSQGCVQRPPDLGNSPSPTAAAQRGGSAAHRLCFAGADAGICRVCDAPGPADVLGRRRTANRGHNIPQSGRAVPSADDRPLQLEPVRIRSRAPRKIL